MNPAQLGPYKIERLLGQGGMGAVYLGRHNETGTQAGVKTLSAGLSQDADFRDRFTDEIESLKKLRHPNIVQLFGWGEQDGQLFYAMEFVDGSTLQNRLEGGKKLPWQEVIAIAIDICKALKHAHDTGIVHRDLKPANLLVDGAGGIKLTDFGIAKLFGQTQITVEGGVVGTADYMAPEQALGQTVTNRCDLYSLGTVMFTLLVGRPPFAAKSLPEVVHKVCYEPAPSLRRFAPDVPLPLEALVDELLQKEPAKRPPTARALQTRLEAMQHGLVSGTRKDDGGDDTDFELDEPTERAKSPNLGVHSATTRFAPPSPSAPSPSAKSSDKTSIGETFVSPTKMPKGKVTRVPLSDATSLVAATAAPASASVMASPTTSGDAQTKFVTVEEEASAAELRERQSQRAQRWITLALCAVLVVAAGLVAWQMFVPPSADDVYNRIAKAAAGGDADLADAADDIARFLQHFPQDSRAAEVSGYRDEIELSRMQNSFERRARRLSATASLTPVERAYLDAVEIGRSRPEAAIARLAAILAVYGDDEKAPKSTQQVVTLARRQMASLQHSIKTSSAEHLAELQARLATAKKLAATKREDAANIYRGIVTLYADKPWAASIVAEARRELAVLEAMN